MQINMDTKEAYAESTSRVSEAYTVSLTTLLCGTQPQYMVVMWLKDEHRKEGDPIEPHWCKEFAGMCALKRALDEYNRWATQHEKLPEGWA